MYIVVFVLLDNKKKKQTFTHFLAADILRM